MDEPLPPSQVKKLLIEILAQGTLGFLGHAQEEMANDRLTEIDVRNTLRGGVVQPGEYRKHTWRYQVTTTLLAAVVSFRSEVHAVVVTAWRLKKK